MGAPRKVDFVRRRVSTVTLARIGCALEIRSCRYFGSRGAEVVAWVRLGRWILSLLVSLALSLHVLGVAWNADYIDICVSKVIFARIGCALEFRFCRYVGVDGAVDVAWVRLGTQIMLRFACPK